MKTVTYEKVKLLAADLAGFPRGKLPTSDATMLRAFFAAELPDLWTREAWPELCDHLEAVSLDASRCFSLRETEDDEMGDILAVIIGGDPRTTTKVSVLSAEQITRLENRVNVMSELDGAVWVDWQTPVPDLLDNDDLDIDDDAALGAYELPARFKLPLAARGAALLVADENPQKAATLRALAESELMKQAALVKRPWWRK